MNFRFTCLSISSLFFGVIHLVYIKDLGIYTNQKFLALLGVLTSILNHTFGFYKILDRIVVRFLFFYYL